MVKRVRDPRSRELITWELARSTLAMCIRAATALDDLERDVDAWHRANPIPFEAIPTEDGWFGGVYVLTETPEVPASFMVVAAEILHAVRQVHDHLDKAKRTSLTMPTPWPPAFPPVWADVQEADNYAKHQALPVSYMRFHEPMLTLFIGSDRWTIRPTTRLAASQRRDPFLVFRGDEFDRLADRAVAAGAEAQWIVHGEPKLAFGWPLFQDDEKPMLERLKEAVHWMLQLAVPFQEWLSEHPDRPLEVRPWSL